MGTDTVLVPTSGWALLPAAACMHDRADAIALLPISAVWLDAD